MTLESFSLKYIAFYVTYMYRRYAYTPKALSVQWIAYKVPTYL